MPWEEPAGKPAKTLHTQVPGLPGTPKTGLILEGSPFTAMSF